jgi:hypothetical protein
MYLLFFGILNVVIIIMVAAIAIIVCVGVSVDVDIVVHGVVVVRLEIRHTSTGEPAPSYMIHMYRELEIDR